MNKLPQERLLVKSGANVDCQRGRIGRLRSCPGNSRHGMYLAGRQRSAWPVCSNPPPHLHLESCSIERPVLAEPGQENVHPRRLRCQLDVYLRAEVQRLCARELLAHHNLATQVKRNQLKDCLTKITVHQYSADAAIVRECSANWKLGPGRPR